ncbi:MAG: Hsp20/alpha crystallin family protein [Flavipsychrobacter sp.]
MYNHKTNRVATPTLGGFFENAFKNNFGNVFYDDNWSNTTAPANIKETETAYVLDLVAPGLKKEDFKIKVEKDVLYISFTHEEAKEENTDKVLRNEYQFRSFKRSFSLSEKVNAANISATYNDGILKITLPKKENIIAEVKEISVG